MWTYQWRLGSGHDEVFNEHETACDLAPKRVSRATFESKVEYVLVKVSLCVTFEGKVVCNL